MESTANLMIFCGIRRKFYKFHGKQQNAMANLETGGSLLLEATLTKMSLNALVIIAGS